MLNFYKLYNKLGLDNEEFLPLIDLLQTGIFDNRLKPIEHIIKTSPYHACHYAIKVLKCRWLEAEPVLMTSGFYSSHYAVTVLKGRWLEAEPVIITDPLSICRYATGAMKGRWYEAEDTLSASTYWTKEYNKAFNI